MAPDSASAKRLPSGPCWSTIAGILLFGEMARNSGLNCSPAPMSTACTRYSSPVSSSMMWILCPLGVGQVYRSIIVSPQFYELFSEIFTFEQTDESPRRVFQAFGDAFAILDLAARDPA